MTGVASGGMGTGANLDDTEVFRTEDLAEAASSPPAEPIARPVPAAPVRPAIVPRRSSSNRPPGRGLAGLLAAALVVLVGVAFVVTRDGGTLGAGQTVPSAAAPATTAPDASAGGGNGDPRGGGNDRGNDKDKDKPCHGNGNGNGRDCGDDDDDDDD